MDLEVRTDRLLLRRWRDADREPFAQLTADTEVMTGRRQDFRKNLLSQRSDRHF